MKAAPLRVRQLERRRVLDGAVTSVVVSTVVVADASQPAPVATTTNATDAPPIVAPVESPARSNSTDTASAISQLGEPGDNVPPVLVAATDQQVDEGQSLNLSAANGAPPLALYIDPDLADSHTASVDWGDGSPVQDATIIAGVGAGAIGGTHVYADEGSYTVTVSVADSNGGSDSQSFNVLVKNVPPVLITAIDQTVNEGQELDLSASGGAPLGLFVDPGVLDTHTATVNWGDGSATENATVIETMGAGTLGGTHTYTDDGLYVVTVTVTDNDGGSASDTFSVLVENLPPVLVTATDQTVNEGQELDLSASGGAPLGLFVDPGVLDTHTATVNWGDGSPTENTTVIETMGAGTLGGTHTYADNGLYIVTVTVTDDDGGSATGTFKVTVNNVEPFVDLTGPTSVDEGSLNNWTLGPVVDPGTDTVTQYIIHWGDGNTDTFTAAQIAGMSGAVGHTYADGPNNYTIAVDLVDEDGTHLAVDTLAVTVNNVPPVVELTGPTNVNEGAPNTWMLGAVVDPGTDTVSQYVIHWGDGNTDTFTAAQIVGMGNAIGHTYVEGPNNYTISVDLVDEDGTYLVVDTLAVTVNNVPPVLVTATDQMVNEGQELNLSASGGVPLGLFVDQGVLDTHTATVNWGDGSATENATVVETTGAGTLGGTHIYADDGLYTVTVTVTDDDGGSSSGTFKVLVNNVPPVLTTVGNQTVNEGAPLTITDLGQISDPGFKDVLLGTDETFRFWINWGDSTAPTPDTGDATADHVGGPLDPTLASFDGQHTYADDGDYLVTVRVADDNMAAYSNAALFATGVAGVDFVEKTFVVHVDNVSPTVAVPNGNQTILEGGTISFANLATFTDPGFDNPLNPNAPVSPNIADPLHESFTYDIDWGDGRDAVTGASAVDFNGGPGTPSSGTIGGSHTYADDGTYTVKVTVHDDNGGSSFATFTVTVNNVGPTVVAPNGDQTILEGGIVSFANLATFTDPGFDNPLNPNTAVPPNITDPLHESFTYDINWGDGRNQLTGASITDENGGPGTPSSGMIAASHVYADDGTYTVIVTVHDDNGGVSSAQFTVTVNNVAPSITGPINDLVVNEGQPFVLSDLGASTFNLGLGVTDPGFDNPLNPNPASPAIADPTHENFTGVSINWGDGTVTDALAVVNRSTDLIDGPTTALLQHTPHVYADDGDYTVTITAFDDNGGPLTPQTITIHVNNVTPTLTLTGDSFTVNEGQVMNIPNLGAFSDPGFTDSNNTPPSAETFTYFIDWGDGTTQTGQLPAMVTQGTRPNSATPEITIPTLGTLANSHLYVDNPAGGNTYTVTVRLADDDMSANFTGGLNGVDYVEQRITVTVLNVSPTLQPITATDLTSGGDTTLNLTFSDPGADTYKVYVNWGDNNGFVEERATTVPGATTGTSFTIIHHYSGPPDPLNPTAKITITVEIRDDDATTPGVVASGISNDESTQVDNPGIQEINIAIDTTPDVPRLALVVQQQPPVILSQVLAAPSSLQPPVNRVPPSELTTVSDRYFELVVVSPDGKERERYRLSDEALLDVRGLFATLPDNRYKIYLFRADNNSRRLVLDVFVRRGRIVDVSDETEGARDRVPAAEGAQQKNVLPNNVPPAGRNQQAVPLQNNPLLNRLPDAKAGAANEADPPAVGRTAVEVMVPGEELSDTQPARLRGSMRWALPLAGLRLVASRQSWSERLGAALETADDRAWRRLRRAARLGNSGHKSGGKLPVDEEKLSAARKDPR